MHDNMKHDNIAVFKMLNCCPILKNFFNSTSINNAVLKPVTFGAKRVGKKKLASSNADLPWNYYHC